MAKVLIGNFKGTKGDKGDTGATGVQGKTGATGQRGSRWTEGTAITGTSTTATIFSGTGIADALVNDQYLNTSTGNVYRCTVAGAASVAKWVYVGCIKGASGVVSDATTSAHGLMSAADKKALDVLNKPLATCATGRATAAKVATLANFILQVGATIAVKFTDTAGTANPASGNLTLNVNGSGAKTIAYFRNGNKAALTYASGNYFYNNATHIFIFDGMYWLCMDWNADNDTTYANMTAATASAAGKAGLVPAPAAGKQGQYLRGDGTWATPANTVTTVVNNNTTTAAGYALDARQANPNVAGSLGAQIEALNSSLANGFKIRPHVVYQGVVHENTNVILETNSMYLFFSMTDISGEEYNSYIAFIYTGKNNINRVNIVGEGTPGWSALPTSGGTIQGLYPLDGAYNHVSIIKVYSF